MPCQVSDSISKKLEYAGKKTSKTFAMIKSEMDEKAKRKSKSQSRVGMVVGGGRVEMTINVWLSRWMRWPTWTSRGTSPSAWARGT